MCIILSVPAVLVCGFIFKAMKVKSHEGKNVQMRKDSLVYLKEQEVVNISRGVLQSEKLLPVAVQMLISTQWQARTQHLPKAPAASTIPRKSYSLILEPIYVLLLTTGFHSCRNGRSLSSKI